MVEQTWTQRIQKSGFPAIAKKSATGALYCSPENIITCLRDKQMLEGLALVVAWGGMARTSQYIYRETLPTIETTLLQASALIVQDQTIQDAWRLLREKLGWSSVMTSKCLHFAARSLNFAINPPVALDNGVVIKKVSKLHLPNPSCTYAACNFNNSSSICVAWL